MLSTILNPGGVSNNCVHVFLFMIPVQELNKRKYLKEDNNNLITLSEYANETLLLLLKLFITERDIKLLGVVKGSFKK